MGLQQSPKVAKSCKTGKNHPTTLEAQLAACFRGLLSWHTYVHPTISRNLVLSLDPVSRLRHAIEL